MTFEEHLKDHQRADGTYDLEGAEKALAAELAASKDEITRLAARAAKQERADWGKREGANLRKQFVQPALSPELELDVKVPLGDSVVVELGDMNDTRIQIRKNVRTKHHLDEIRAFDSEMTFWINTERLLPPGSTVRSVTSWT